MTYRQRILKAIYPLLMWMSKITGKKSRIMDNKEHVSPANSLYDLSLQLNNGKELHLDALKGKKILLVNTASNCGYTHQYAGLQELYDLHKDKLAVIGFPANDFAEQEKGTDDEIAEFCQVNFGVSFPLVKKSTVLKGPGQHPVFRWLSDKHLNGWNDQAPTWNFSKYLVSEDGVLLNYFDPAIAPEGKEIQAAIVNGES